MINRIDVIRRSPICRPAVLAALAAATVAGLAAFSAQAQQDYYHNKPPEQARREAHPQVDRRQHEQYVHRYDGYYRQPDVYYTAPPVIYPPAGYYQQPGVSLNFSLPFIR